MSNENEIFDPDFLGRLRQLFFMLRKRRQLRKHGVQQTPTAGFTREFKDHRQYIAGDDYRSIDWRLFARLEKLFIRVFEEVQEFHVHVVVDRSQSMIEPFAQKRVMELQLAVALAYLALVSQHSVSIHTLGEDTRREMQPLKGQGHITRIIQHLSNLKYEGKTDLVRALRQFKPHQHGRGIVFLISDLFGEDPTQSDIALREARLWPTETHVIHIVHPRELDPNLEGDFRLYDVETEEVRRMWLTRREMVAYRKLVDQFMEDVQQTCTQGQVDYMCWTTDQSFEDMFVNLLIRGSALAGS